MVRILSKLRKVLLKTARFLLFFVLGLLIVVNLFILLSGRTYLYKGLACTYFIGESGPNIYDLEYFYSHKIAASNVPFKWKEASLLNNGMTKQMKNYFAKTQTRAFLVFKGDSLLSENYFGNHTKETVSNVFSASKTVTALMIGAAIDDGAIKSIDDKVSKYLDEFKEGEKSKITIRHLLQMASGLDWTESGKDPLSNNAESYYGSGLYELATRQKVINEPGKTFIYQSGNSQLLGYIVEKATGKTLSEYVREKLWEPIGAESEAYWALDDENGDEKAFCCLNANARDIGKIGKLLINGGSYNGKQIISEKYIREMVELQKMNTEEGVANHQYGLHIWVYENAGTPVYYCRGIKGQYIFVLPDEDLVIVRLGKERMPNFAFNQMDQLNDHDLKNVGHPTDVPIYIEFGRQLAKK